MYIIYSGWAPFLTGRSDSIAASEADNSPCCLVGCFICKAPCMQIRTQCIMYMIKRGCDLFLADGSDSIAASEVDKSGCCLLQGALPMKQPKRQHPDISFLRLLLNLISLPGIEFTPWIIYTSANKALWQLICLQGALPTKQPASILKLKAEM